MSDSQRESDSPESSWWILAKVGLFIAVPTLLVLAVKMVIQ
jgi:hypothetical protein